MEHALRALRAGRPEEAYERLVRICDHPGAPTQAVHGLAVAALRTGRAEEALSVADRLLASRPQQFEFNLVKADALAALGRSRIAASFYRGAVEAAARGPALPAGHRAEVERARAAIETLARRFEEHLRDGLNDAGLTSRPDHRRLRHAVDVMMGAGTPYVQRPTTFFMPGLTAAPVWDACSQPWHDQLRAGLPAVQAEARALLSREGAFSPYVGDNPVAPVLTDTQYQDESWGSVVLWDQGSTVGGAAAAPEAAALARTLPLAVLAGRSPNVLFSRLTPGAHISPHHGQTNVRLICHLPLIVPEGCALRVGPQEVTVRAGEVILFDDTFEHEAWNKGRTDRVVLILDVWHPDLTEEERRMLGELFDIVAGQD